MLHVLDLHAPWGALEEDGARVPCQRYGTYEDHDGDEHARRRVCVVACFVLRLPDDDGGNNDTDVVDGVPDDC